MSTTSFSRVLTSPAGRGDRHRLLGAPRSASPYGLTTPLCQRPRAAGPLPSSLPGVCRHFHPHRCRARATCALRPKIPGAAAPESGQQKRAPDLGGGRAARDDRAPCYEAGVSTALLSTARSLAAGILHHGLGSQRAVRRETPVSPACSPPREGQQSSVRETHLDQLRNRARRHQNATISSRWLHTLQYAPSRLHFHPLPCLAQTSRFATWDVG
jgi:hypothetical protein